MAWVNKCQCVRSGTGGLVSRKRKVKAGPQNRKPGKFIWEIRSKLPAKQLMRDAKGLWSRCMGHSPSAEGRWEGSKAWHCSMIFLRSSGQSSPRGSQ